MVITGFAGAGDLYYEARGSGTPIVLMHGFSGSAELMSELASGLAARHHVVSVDLPGHGRSAGPGPHSYDLTGAARRVLAAVRNLGLVTFHLAGYSMGGRVALMLAVDDASALRSVVAISASAGIASTEERSLRRRADEDLAARIEARGIEWFEDYWSSQELLRPRSEAGRRAAEKVAAVRRSNDAGALAAALRGLGTGTMPYLGDRLADLDIPALFAAGGEDARYVSIADELAASVPDGRRVVIDGAGHSVPTDDPRALAESMLAFFADVETRAVA